ncbi:hypothetical protein GCM10018793_07940 [Streptomyces sulfonofaciens]|uniref:AB hydrolase-1 domain-containing protein n=1 Tax=Streptomyces sulfonofaciens TaxID=68272 RepID=A0A919FU68_9ACTN|nr:alpha/beta hydrolase [Streptomyces sulfonofaciens]GHH71854.1 hypothetical protein GCM10018793_07940 [Streptomyces sulfonofaciens]
MARTSRRIEFPGSEGAPLAARLELPEGPPRACAVFAHCFTCGKDGLAAARISRALSAGGLAVLRFDFTGLGDSGGDFSRTTFSSNVEDLVRAAEYLRETVAAPSVLIGHSLGGAAVLAAASRIPETRAVVTIGAPADPAHVTKSLGAARAEIEALGAAEVDLGGRTFRIRRSFLDDLAVQPQSGRIRRLGVPLLVLHSPVDRVVEVDNARLIFDTARHPKSFVALDGADHLLTSRADSDYVAEVLRAWVGRYLPVLEGAAPRREERVPGPRPTAARGGSRGACEAAGPTGP